VPHFAIPEALPQTFGKRSCNLGSRAGSLSCLWWWRAFFAPLQICHSKFAADYVLSSARA